MSALADFDRLSGKLYLGGELVGSSSSQHFDVIEPATEERLGSIADATDAEVDRAIDIAGDARKAWNAIDPRSRAVTLHDIAALIRRDKSKYAELLTREEGKPFKESADEVSWCATAIDYYAELARHETGRIAGSTVPGQFHFSVKEPLGTIVIILPFNYPLVLLCWEASAALAAGNAVIGCLPCGEQICIAPPQNRSSRRFISALIMGSLVPVAHRRAYKKLSVNGWRRTAPRLDCLLQPRLRIIF